MRISDWSSDVCSSDLVAATAVWRAGKSLSTEGVPAGGLYGIHRLPVVLLLGVSTAACLAQRRVFHLGSGVQPVCGIGVLELHGRCVQPYRSQAVLRSEEHTSELQSLMRISYAV